MATYIETLKVHNAGPFKDLSVHFNPKVNIIIGTNGVGKTSVLRCIAMAPFVNYHKAMRVGENGSFCIYTNEENQKHRYGYGWDTATKYQTQMSNFKPFPAEPDVISHFGQKDHLCKLFSIGANRYFSYKQIDGMKREPPVDERKKNIISQNISYLDTTEMPNVKQWMINRYFVIDKEWAGVEKYNWNKLNDLLSTLAPKGIQFAFERIERDLEPIFSLNHRECYLEELSSGYKSVLSMLFSIIDWIEGVNEGEQAYIDKAEGTVLIDEIDTHLHPSWQSSILTTLCTIFPNLQFIVTTHSPFVISNALPNQLIYLSGITDNIDVKPLEKGFVNWQIKDILRDLMGVQDTRANGLNQVLENLDNSFSQGNVANYDSSLSELKTLVGPNDSILNSYEMKRSAIFLQDDQD